MTNLLAMRILAKLRRGKTVLITPTPGIDGIVVTKETEALIQGTEEIGVGIEGMTVIVADLIGNGTIVIGTATEIVVETKEVITVEMKMTSATPVGMINIETGARTDAMIDVRTRKGDEL